MSLKDELPNLWDDTPEDEFYASQGVRNKKDFFKTPHGTIFTQDFLPVELQPKGILCMTHGYGSDTSWTFQILALEAVKWGYAVYGADMLGHGRSDGILGYTPDVQKVAAASLTFFKEMPDSDVNKGLPAFLFGESMGGGVTFLMHFQDPTGWDGFIFASPLFKMPELMRPTRLEILGFSLLRRFVDTWELFPRAREQSMIPSKEQQSSVIHDGTQASPALARCLSSPEWSTTSAQEWTNSIRPSSPCTALPMKSRLLKAARRCTRRPPSLTEP